MSNGIEMEVLRLVKEITEDNERIVDAKATINVFWTSDMNKAKLKKEIEITEESLKIKLQLLESLKSFYKL